ncbi:MAG: Fur family transcriptional regulator, ferric uptake regulator [Actinomycetota bacterium]|nr:Fur family transcriptional regulator, ferric uptake regulator [Actinomycetota bacterium]
MTAAAVQVLHEHGYRATPQRLLVLAAVGELRHATPEQILAHIHQTSPGVNLSTVYRVLEVLEDVDLVTHAHIGSGSATYHATDGPAHLHFRCGGCGRVQSLPAIIAEPFVQQVRERLGFHADVTHAGIDGRCRECAATQEQP